MEEIEIRKEAILEGLKQEIINLNNQITNQTIKDATKEELIKYLEIMGKIREELNLV